MPDSDYFSADPFQAADEELLAKLDLTTQRLAAQLRECETSTSLSPGVISEGPLSGAALATDASLRPTLMPSASLTGLLSGGAMAITDGTTGQQHLEQQRLGRRHGDHNTMEIQRMLRLCGLLRRSLLRGGAGLEGDGDDLSRLFAVRVRGWAHSWRGTGAPEACRAWFWLFLHIYSCVVEQN